MRLKRIGFSRFIKKTWLDGAALSLRETENQDDAREYLERWLIGEDLGKEAKRKTIDVLTRIWIRVPDDQLDFREKGKKLYFELKNPERIYVHWGLMLIAYPIFHDVASTIGRLLSLQGKFTAGQIKRGIIKEWGDRTTLTRSVERILQSMIDWDIIKKNAKTKEYNNTKKIKTENAKLKLWITEAILRSGEKQAFSIHELERHPSIFPFEYEIPIKEVKESEQFELLVQGLNNQTIRITK
jgi:hypothetical protein